MNLTQKSVSRGGKLVPIIIPHSLTNGTGLMNPSIFIDDDGDILVVLRHVNYTLYHSENNQQFPSTWGPLSYSHPEHDQVLATINYLCRLDEDLNVVDYTIIDTSALDVPPVWEFTGEEDCRLVRWDGDLYAIGVRRDVPAKNGVAGEGRMELSKIELDKDAWVAKEVSRIRIPAPGEDTSYCEKNWVPIIDKPYHFVKWHSPVEVVRTYPDEPGRCEQVSLKDSNISGADQRGSSQLIRWGNKYISFSHEVNLWHNYLSQKDGIYRHRLCVWDEDINLIGLSPEPLSFLDARIEFCAGAAKYNDDLLISFGFQDNAAFILTLKEDLVNEMIEEAIKNVN